MSIKINDKRFLKYVKETLADYEVLNSYDVVIQLRDLLSRKELTISNSFFLLDFLHYRKNNPSHYDLEFKMAMQQGLTFIDAKSLVNELKKEHKYMYKILIRYFDINEIMSDFISISYKNNIGKAA